MRIAIAALLLTACGAESTTSHEAAPKAPAAAPAAAPAEPATASAAAPAATPTAAGDWETFGEGFPAVSPVVLAKDLLDKPADYAGKTLTVEGEIADVCQKKGCWMVVSDGQRTMRVTMKDHAFGVDMASTGRSAQVYGELVAKAVDPKTVAHYQSEAAKPDMVPEASAEGGEAYQLVASAVRIRKPAAQ